MAGARTTIGSDVLAVAGRPVVDQPDRGFQPAAERVLPGARRREVDRAGVRAAPARFKDVRRREDRAVVASRICSTRHARVVRGDDREGAGFAVRRPAHLACNALYGRRRDRQRHGVGRSRARADEPGQDRERQEPAAARVQAVDGASHRGVLSDQVPGALRPLLLSRVGNSVCPCTDSSGPSVSRRDNGEPDPSGSPSAFRRFEGASLGNIVGPRRRCRYKAKSGGTSLALSDLGFSP